MNTPQFNLATVMVENDSAPEIIPLDPSPRRAFLGGLSAAAALALLGGCGRPRPESAPKEPALLEAPRARLRAHLGAVTNLHISPDGQNLTSSASDRKRKTWSLAECRWLKTEASGFRKGESGAGAAVFDHKLSAAAAAPNLHDLVLRRLPDNRRIAGFAGHSSEIRAIAFSPDSKLIVSGDEDGVILLWQTEPPAFRGYLFDLHANEAQVKANVYSQRDKLTGNTLFYTLPCDATLPTNAACICNCVAGTHKEPSIVRQPRRRANPSGGDIRVPEYRAPEIRIPSERPVTVPGRRGTAPCGSPIPPGAICTCNCI